MAIQFKELIQTHEKQVLDRAKRIEKIIDEEIKSKFNGYAEITITLRISEQIPVLVIKKLKELYYDWHMSVEEDNTDVNAWLYTIYMKGKPIETSYR
jgi:hypothetical protein